MLKLSSARPLFLAVLASLSVLPAIFPVESPSAATVTSDFTWSPRFALLGATVNFTASPAGGTPPYTFSWNFADGSANATGSPAPHAYKTAGTYSVTLAVKDSAASTNTTTHNITIQQWPLIRDNWMVRWNTTSNDGINIWNVTYKGTLVIRDARLPGVQVTYVDTLAGPFYDEPTNTYRDDIIGGQMSYQNSTDPSNPWWEILANYNVPGYNYSQFWRFYPNGRWDAGLNLGHAGYPYDHVYVPHWRMDLSILGGQSNFMGQFTPGGAWQDLIWEGEYTDNGSRDTNYNNTIWSFGGFGNYYRYHIAPSIFQAALDLPLTPSSIVLLRHHPNEVESNHVVLFETPAQWLNGELAFRRNIVFWFLPEVADHGPVAVGPSSQVILSFYPVGF